MIRSFVDNSFSYLEKELRSIKTYEQLRKFYVLFFKKFNKLNTKYKFSIATDIKYINKQLKNIDFKKKDVFFGIPFGIKDIFNTKFLKTEFGSILFKNFLPGNNARVVDIIEEKQGVIFCKTTTAEFAVHHFPAKKTLNPHNSKNMTGTSSAGSAVSVSCGALPVSLGTQTAGSIIRPASFCGVIGFKPSFGALDRTGILKTTDTLDNVGLFSSDIYGVKQVFKNLIQYSNQYPYSKKFFLKKKNKKIKIAVISNNFKYYKDYDDIVKKDFDFFCKRHLKSYDCEVDLKIKFIEGIHQYHDNIYCKSLAYYFSSLQKRKIKMSKIMLNMIKKGRKINKKSYLRALLTQQNLTKKFEQLMKNYDFLITPSTATVAPLIGKNEKKDTSLIWSFFGAPSISLPIFYDKITELPFGLQIISSRYNDIALLNFSEKIIKNLKK
jgi:Asp-tRNA(Asn)/Glu-tRNA(Gln) amidotransferase A subunit family amidase